MSHHLPDTLTHTLSPHLELGKSRLQTLSWLIIGLVNARTVNLSHLASQCSGSAQIASSYRRLQRFFQYVTLEGDWLALAVVRLLKLKAPWVLCLDRTNWQIGRHVSRTRFPWTQNWRNRSVQGGPEHDRQF